MFGSVISTLIAPYMNEGHSVSTDNLYTCPALPVSSQIEEQFLGYSIGQQKRYASSVTEAFSGAVHSVPVVPLQS